MSNRREEYALRASFSTIGDDLALAAYGSGRGLQLSRFDELVAKLKKRKGGMSDEEAKGIAANVGRAKYGKRKFAQMGAAGRRHTDSELSLSSPMRMVKHVLGIAKRGIGAAKSLKHNVIYGDTRSATTRVGRRIKQFNLHKKLALKTGAARLGILGGATAVASGGIYHTLKKNKRGTPAIGASSGAGTNDRVNLSNPEVARRQQARGQSAAMSLSHQKKLQLGLGSTIRGVAKVGAGWLAKAKAAGSSLKSVKGVCPTCGSAMQPVGSHGGSMIRSLKVKGYTSEQINKFSKPLVRKPRLSPESMSLSRAGLMLDSGFGGSRTRFRDTKAANWLSIKGAQLTEAAATRLKRRQLQSKLISARQLGGRRISGIGKFSSNLPMKILRKNWGILGGAGTAALYYAHLRHRQKQKQKQPKALSHDEALELAIGLKDIVGRARSAIGFAANKFKKVAPAVKGFFNRATPQGRAGAAVARHGGDMDRALKAAPGTLRPAPFNRGTGGFRVDRNNVAHGAPIKLKVTPVQAPIGTPQIAPAGTMPQTGGPRSGRLFGGLKRHLKVAGVVGGAGLGVGMIAGQRSQVNRRQTQVNRRQNNQ